MSFSVLVWAVSSSWVEAARRCPRLPRQMVVENGMVRGQEVRMLRLLFAFFLPVLVDCVGSTLGFDEYFRTKPEHCLTFLQWICGWIFVVVALNLPVI
jgi:hypothetical protein